MSTAPPPLAPIFRSDTQLQILGATYLEPDRHFAIAELVERSGRPQPTVAREVDRLVEAGLLETELRSGRRSVWANSTSPIFDELHSILLKTIGPKAVLERLFRGLRGIDRALIYGSWARRYHGEAGPLPQDVDLMVIGTGDLAEIRAGADQASRTLGRDVNVTMLSPDEWDNSQTGFVAHLKSQPVVELDVLQ
ncbi:MarR family transcriptional regulator [Jatrophihabitans sp.]|uniref:MarR family transcriptional regulator n=1 Tax=Jatrophihabitans sp. TaxID=1932789 RepID=UPI002C4F973D|nr:MarR family transcriptional regulator [Jatrophihabitans sp.]